MIEKYPSRQKLKLSCLRALDALAVEHESGHQGELAARYILRTEHDVAVKDAQLDFPWSKGGWTAFSAKALIPMPTMSELSLKASPVVADT